MAGALPDLRDLADLRGSGGKDAFLVIYRPRVRATLWCIGILILAWHQPQSNDDKMQYGHSIPARNIPSVVASQ